jgi:signal transduction histidine kinase
LHFCVAIAQTAGMSMPADHDAAPEPHPAGGAPQRLRQPGRALLLVATGLILMLLVVGSLLAWQTERSERRRATDQAGALAEAVAAQADRFLRERLDYLQAVAAAPALQSRDPAAIRPALQALRPAQVGFAGGFSWVDAAGYARVSTVQDLSAQPVDVRERDDVRAVLTTGAPSVGRAITNRTSGVTIVPLAVPIRDRAGELTGLLTAGVSFDRLDQIFAGYRRSGVGAVHVVDRAGQLLISDVPDGALADVGTVPVVTEARTRQAGARTGVTDPGGGADQLVVYRPAPTGAWVVFVSRPMDDAFGRARTTLQVTLAGLVGLALVGLVGAGWTARRLSREAAAQAALLVQAQEEHAAAEAARAEAERANQAKDEFLSVAAHELKTPLTSLKGFVQLLSRGLAQRHPERTAEALAVMDHQTDRLTRLVDDLLEVSRLATNRVHLALEPVRLDQLVAGVLTRLQVVTATHRVVQDNVVAATVRVDPDRIEQVLTNLLTNAVKFSPAGSTITVAMLRLDDMVVVSVTDEGIGIPVERQARVFEQFYQAHEDTLHHTTGMGIGLYISHEMVILHGGDLWFTSAPGQGSTFSFRLPVQNDAVPAG